MDKIQVSRRQFLTTTTGATAGMASWLALGKAPAFAQKRELTFLSWNHFVPASDDELRKQAEAFGKQAGVTVRVDTIAHLQLPAKRAAEAAGAVRPRLAPHGRRRSVHLREPARRRRRRHRRPRQEVRRLVSLRRRVRPNQVRLAGGAVVLDLLPGHVQHGPLQEGRARISEDLGRAAQARQGAQEAGQPGGYRHQPLRRRQHHVLVGAVVSRRQGRSRSTARPRRSTPTRRRR